MSVSWLRILGSIIVSALVAAGCSSAKKIEVGGACILNSDCNGSLVCTAGKCHDACHTTADARLGLFCINTRDSVICQLPAEAKCSATSSCDNGSCAPDQHCRTGCLSVANCTPGQVCVSNFCAETSDLVNGQLPQTAGSDAGIYDASSPDLSFASPADVPVPAAGPEAGVTHDASDASAGTPDADSGISSGVTDAGCDADGRSLCDIGCVDLMNDKYNCGRCGQKCLVSCSSGQCNVPVELSGGAGHNCVRLSNGAVVCWGYNSHGQLGSGSPANALSPVKTMLGSLGQGKAVSIAAGSTHSCAVLLDGSVTCWGWNTAGELGSNTGPDGSLYPVSTAIASGALAVAVSGGYASGGRHSCVLLSGGAVTCWGDNTYGELGGVPADAGAPVSPTDISGATQVIAGPGSTCVLEVDGSVRCWGAMDIGQSSKTPVPVPGLSGGVKYIAASPDDYLFCGTGASATGGGPFAHACALLSDGSVRCWGTNYYGELGDLANGILNSSTAVPVAGVSGATAIGVGITHSCAVVSGGKVMCWGLNWGGQLGNGSTASVDGGVGGGMATVAGVTNAKAVVAGSCHSCALLNDGNVQCWGDGSLGQLGNGTTMSSPTPVTVTW
jgi:hypothetical protein